MVQIREAQLADAAEIARVHVDAWRTTYQQILPAAFLAGLAYEQRETMWQAILSVPEQRQLVLVAVDETDNLIGFASGGPEQSGKLGCDAELYAIYLLQHHQGQGIGRQLFGQLAQRLQAAGFQAMMLWVAAANPARHFYEKLGGVALANEEETIGGVTIPVLAYGWHDLSALVKSEKNLGARPLPDA